VFVSQKENIMKSLFVKLRIMLLDINQIAFGGAAPEKTARMNTQNHRSLRTILLSVFLTILIGEACTLTGVGVPPTPTKIIFNPADEALQGPCAFSATGKYSAGWYWLRDVTYTSSGQWNCFGLPTDRDLTISLAALVTNKADGGSGYSSPVKITYINPSSNLAQTVQIYLQNSLPEQSPVNSQGAGYPTTGYFVIPKDYIDTKGRLFVQLERFKPNSFHVAVNVKSLAFDRPRLADLFLPSKGVLIANWYWLSDTAHQAYGQWNFRGLDPAEPAMLVFALQVTNRSNGGSGFSTPIEVTLINPANNSQKTLRHVIAQNLLFSQSRSGSNGIGYQTYGSIELDNSSIDSLGNLTVRVARLQDAANYMAVAHNSVAIIQPEVTHDFATPSPSATLTSSLDGLPGGKYMFIQYWNSVTGTGTLPALAIDFPDYRFDQKTGTLSAFNPNQSIKLASTALGLIGHGTSRSGDAGTGAVSSLDTINHLPYSMDVLMFTGTINLKAGPNMEETKPVGLKILTVAEDGTISIRLGDKNIMLAPGQSWTQTVEADVHEGKYQGRLSLTSILTNYGWQDRSKINLP
jgi:hypothetical protein